MGFSGAAVDVTSERRRSPGIALRVPQEDLRRKWWHCDGQCGVHAALERYGRVNRVSDDMRFSISVRLSRHFQYTTIMHFRRSCWCTFARLKHRSRWRCAESEDQKSTVNSSQLFIRVLRILRFGDAPYVMK